MAYKLVYHSSLGFRAAPIQMLLLEAGVAFEMVEPFWGEDRVVVLNVMTFMLSLLSETYVQSFCV